MTEITERGDIYFLYRPRVEEDEVRSLEDVQRLHIVLRPRGGTRYRRLVVGRKRLPDPSESGRERFWGFVDSVKRRGHEVGAELGRDRYETATRGERVQPEARPAGEGVYVIARHDDHTHLVYELELPRRGGEPQEELNLEPQANYIISVKNPEVPAPPGAGLGGRQQADLPEDLHDRFRGRRFVAVDPTSFLDHEGVEFVLIAASEDVLGELDVRLDAERESAETADIFSELKLDRERQPTRPLIQGEWE